MMIRLDRPIGFRVFEENYRINSVKEHPFKTYEWGFFMKTEDDFLDWIDKEAEQNIKNKMLFNIITINEDIDIVMRENDKIEITPYKNHLSG